VGKGGQQGEGGDPAACYNALIRVTCSLDSWFGIQEEILGASCIFAFSTGQDRIRIEMGGEYDFAGTFWLVRPINVGG
jgi:hypothetical protein